MYSVKQSVLSLVILVFLTGQAYSFPQGDIRVQLKIVGENGKPLEDVSVDWEMERGPMLKKFDEGSMTVNGIFDKTFEDTAVVSITLYKRGYFLKRLDSFSFGNRFAIVSGDTTFYLNQLVRLLPIGKLDRLVELKAFLEWHPQNGANVIFLDELDFRKSKFKFKRVKGEVNPLYDAITSPMIHCAVVDSETSITPHMIGQRKVSPEDGEVQLIMRNCGPDSGFNLVGQLPQYRSVTQAYFSLKEAPEANYSPSLTIPKKFYGPSVTWRSIYFYFQYDGIYGKGEVYSVTYNEIVGLRMMVRFDFQPNGTRNVRKK